MIELWQTFLQLLQVLGRLVTELIQVGLQWSLLIAWFAWWLLGVNWKRAWPVLAQGAWVPLLLLIFVSALAWAKLAPSDCSCLGFVIVPNFWWQLGGVALLAAVTLFCGWLQGVIHWTPTEVPIEPAEPADTGHAAHH